MNESLLFCEVDEYGFLHWNGFDAFCGYALPKNWRFMTGNAYLCFIKFHG